LDRPGQKSRRKELKATVCIVLLRWLETPLRRFDQRRGGSGIPRARFWGICQGRFTANHVHLNAVPIGPTKRHHGAWQITRADFLSFGPNKALLLGDRTAP
jgi:hypothetical protein